MEQPRPLSYLQRPLTTVPQPITGIYKEIEDRQRAAEMRIQRFRMREQYVRENPRETSMDPYTEASTPPNFSRVDHSRDRRTASSQPVDGVSKLARPSVQRRI